MMASVSWTPLDDGGGREVANYLLGTDGPYILSGADVWRFCMQYLVEAEYNLDLLNFRKGMPNVEAQPFAESRIVGCDAQRRRYAIQAGGDWPPDIEQGRRQFISMRDFPLMVYQSAQYRVRQLIRSSRVVRAAPGFVSTADRGSAGPLFNPAAFAPQGVPEPSVKLLAGTQLTIAPLVLVVIGVIAVAALASSAYVGGEAVHESYELDRYKARIAAETQVKTQVAMAQVAAGKPVNLDALVIGAGRDEERNRWLVPAGAFAGGVVAAGAAGVGLWLHRRKKHA